MLNPNEQKPWPGQIWRDLDPRHSGRLITIDEVRDTFVVVTPYTPFKRKGARSKISTERLRPFGKKKGYEYVAMESELQKGLQS